MVRYGRARAEYLMDTLKISDLLFSTFVHLLFYCLLDGFVLTTVEISRLLSQIEVYSNVICNLNFYLNVQLFNAFF